MCYIGINSEIRETSSNISTPSLDIKKVDKSKFDITTFSSGNIYRIGTRYGCGCKFGNSSIPSEIILEVAQIMKDKREILEKYKRYFENEETIEGIENTVKYYQESVEDTNLLQALIFDLCESNEKVEFFGCWAEEEKKKPDKVMQLKSKSLRIEFKEFRGLNVKMIIKQ